MSSVGKKSASPNKVASRTKEVERSISFSWDKDSTMALLYLCADFQSTHGPKQQYKWAQIAKTFEQRTGKHAPVSTLRNRMEIMKKHYQLWTKLKGSETGLKWNPLTGRIDADSEWWDMKIKENSEYKRFRDKGVSLDMEDLWERLFGDWDATSERCIVPAMDVSPVSTAPGVFEPQPHEYSQSEPTTEDNDDLAAGLERQDRGGSATPSTPIGSTQKRIPDMCTSTIPGRSKRLRLSQGAAAIQDTIQELRLEGRHKYDRIASDCAACTCITSPSPVSEDPADKPVRDAFAVLYRMVADGLVERGSDLFCFATSKILDDIGRKGFMFLESDDDRLAWLLFEMRRR